MKKSLKKFSDRFIKLNSFLKEIERENGNKKAIKKR